MSQYPINSREIFINCVFLALVSIAFWQLWANIFTLLTPEISFPLASTERSRQIEFLIIDPLLITLGVSTIASDRDFSNSKLENFTSWFSLFIFLIADPFIEIAKELSKKKDISLIFSEREDIITSLFSAITAIILLVSVAVIKKRKSLKDN